MYLIRGMPPLRAPLLDELGGILVVRVQHDYNICIQLQGPVVAGFLVAAVSSVLGMDQDFLDAQFAGFLHGGIPAAVIGEDYFVHNVAGNLCVCLFQGFLCIVCRHNHH